MANIRVPKTPKAAFNKNRPASELLLRQVEHLEWAALPASQRKPYQLRKRRSLTEAQAAERIAQLTAMILEAKARTPAQRAAETAAPVHLPPLPKASSGGKKRPGRLKKAASRRSNARSRRRRS